MGRLTGMESPNPHSGTDALTLADGRQPIVDHHSGHPAEEAKGDRWPLDVAVSEDGLVWRRRVTLETEPRMSGCAYPAAVPAADGMIHITRENAEGLTANRR